MKAALVTSFTEPPRYADVDAPDPAAVPETKAIVRVSAAALHQRVRSQADGSHYTSTGSLPLVPGVDGVGLLADGSSVYFHARGGGSMAHEVVVDRRLTVPVPKGVDPALLAASMNPALSSWLGLRKRAGFVAGQSVLILGATGASGTAAVQIARHLGAGRIIAAGRDPERLAALSALGADETVSLHGSAEEVAARLASSAADVDVVVDYLWGSVAEAALPALLQARQDASRTITWVEIGSMAGPSITLPSAALRSNALVIVGSGQGSVSTADIIAETPALIAALAEHPLDIAVRRVPLADVEAAWNEPVDKGERVVFLP